MKIYKCCKCGNTLEAQGPITAFASHLDQRFELKASFENTARLSDKSMQEIKGNLPDKKAESNVTLETSELLKGKLAPFTLAHFEVSLPEGQALKDATHEITLCCQNCGACCDYKS